MISPAAKMMRASVLEAARAEQGGSKLTQQGAADLRAEVTQLAAGLTSAADRAYVLDALSKVADDLGASPKARAILLGTALPPRLTPKILSESSAGKPIKVKAGQQVTINLTSRPSAGYRWTVTMYTPALGAPGELTVIPDPRRVGGRVSQSFTFVPDARIFRSGDAAQIALTYARGSSTPAKMLRFDVEVV